MSRNQIIVLVQGYDNDEIAAKIQDEMDLREDTYEVQQINYFGIENQNVDTTVFILFKPKESKK